jgi:hypothetical protein
MKKLYSLFFLPFAINEILNVGKLFMVLKTPRNKQDGTYI